jgi:hypothetical protein
LLGFTRLPENATLQTTHIPLQIGDVKLLTTCRKNVAVYLFDTPYSDASQPPVIGESKGGE